MGERSLVRLMSLFLLCLLATLSLSQACSDGVLLVGGSSPDGPQLQVRLLTDSGWCPTSGFPDLPEPLDDPGVYHRGGVLLVCGFLSGSPCKYTQRGWQSWEDVFTNFADGGYKMTFSASVGSVMLVSKSLNSTMENHIQHNPVITNPLTNSLLPWMEISGSPFSVSTGGSYPFLYHMDITDSCLGSYNDNLVLTGGYTYHLCTRCTSASSQNNVAVWSAAGNSHNTGPPQFEQGVIPAMLTAREGHGCIEFEGMFLSIGGYAHFYSKGPIVDEPSESFTYHSSGEFYDGQFWAELDSLALPRAHFALQPLCGSLVAIGGISGISEHLDSVERLWTVWNSWIPADYFRLPQPLAHAGSAAVSGLDCW